MYQVSNIGRVRSLDRLITRKDGIVQRMHGAILKPVTTTDGYLRVKLHKEDSPYPICIHRLVAAAFCEKKAGCTDVNHIDFNRKNNCSENLEWVSHGDNVRYSISAGRHFCTRDITGKKNPNYGNDTLHRFYAEHPEVAKINLGRPGETNGMAKRLRIVECQSGEEHEFSWIGGGIAWLAENFCLSVSREIIARKVKSQKQYKGFCFEYID